MPLPQNIAIRKSKLTRLLPKRLLKYAQSAVKPTHFSLIDLGSSTIKVAIVEVSRGAVKVLAHSLVATGGATLPGNRAQSAKLAELVNQALQDAEDASEAVAGRKIVPDHVLFLLPEAHLVGRLFDISHRRANPTEPITEAELDELWAKAMDEARRKLLNLPDVGKDWVPQTLTPAGFWVNENLVNDPVAIQGRNLTLSVYGVISRPEIIDALTTLAERLEVDIYATVPASQAVSSVVPAKTALVINIGAHTTECYLLYQDALTAVGRVPLGGDRFTAQMSDQFVCSLDEAEALKIAYTSDILSDRDVMLVYNCIDPLMQNWGEQMAQVVAQMLIDAGMDLPGDIFFTGGGAPLPGLKERLLEACQAHDLPFSRSPEVEFLGEHSLSGYQRGPIGFRGILFAPVLSLGKTL